MILGHHGAVVDYLTGNILDTSNFTKPKEHVML